MIFDINKKNKILILTYLMILSVTLISYLLIISRDYDINNFKYCYIYFNAFSLISYTLVILLWDMNNVNCIKIVYDSILISITSIPLIFVVFIIGNLNTLNLFTPLIIQTIWGMAVIALRYKLKNIKYKDIFLGVFIFLIMILNSAYLYIYFKYSNSVITTVFDKDIPLIFFLNPLLNILGFTYNQMFLDSQMGYKPVICYLIFWSILFLSIFLKGAYHAKKRKILYNAQKA